MIRDFAILYEAKGPAAIHLASAEVSSKADMYGGHGEGGDAATSSRQD